MAHLDDLLGEDREVAYCIGPVVVFVAPPDVEQRRRLAQGEQGGHLKVPAHRRIE